MKKLGFIRKLTAVAVALFVLLPMLRADGDERKEYYLTGTTGTPAGDYVVQTSSELFHFMGKEYEVFEVYYDDSGANMKIAVNNEGKCTSFVAFNDDCHLFYNCNKYGFGVRKVMFSNPWAHENYCCKKYQKQTVLCKQKKIAKKQAVGLIAAYVPMLKE